MASKDKKAGTRKSTRKGPKKTASRRQLPRKTGRRHDQPDELVAFLESTAMKMLTNKRLRNSLISMLAERGDEAAATRARAEQLDRHLDLMARVARRESTGARERAVLSRQIRQE